MTARTPTRPRPIVDWTRPILVRVVALLALVLGLSAPLAAPAAADPTRIDHHAVWWGDGPYGEQIQIYRINHTLSGDVDVAAIGWTEIRKDGPVRMTVVVANTGSQATKVVFDVFENGKYVRTETYDKAAFEKLTGKNLINKHAEQLLKFYADAKKVTALVDDGQSEIEPCDVIGKECKKNLDEYFPKMTDFYHNIPHKPAGGESATSILNKILRNWKTAGNLTLGSLSAGGLFAPAGYPPYLNTLGGLGAQACSGAGCGTGGGTATLLKPAPAPGVTAKAPGGIDFSTLELRYLADPGPDAAEGVRYAFSAAAADGNRNAEAGRTAAVQASDAFFVWLRLPPDKFWVNLNPEEPDRIVDPELGTTDAGRILLQADLLMKKTVAKLIHPDSATGKAFWNRLDIGGDRTTCLSFRQWISPAPAQVREDGDAVYIVDAPLVVQLESEFLKNPAASGGCAASDQRMQESVYRDLILPKVQDAVNKAPEYAELRRVYLSRVAAEWYRERSAKQPTRYADMIDKGDVSSWPARQNWSPKTVFDQYRTSYMKGEFRVKRQRRDGDFIVTETYVFGGVDLSRIPFTRMDQATFESRRPGLSTVVKTAMVQATAERADQVWIGSVTAAPVPEVVEDPGGMARIAERTGNRWLWVIAGAALAALLLVSMFARPTPVRPRARTAIVVLVLVAAAGTFLVTRDDGTDGLGPAVTTVAIPSPVLVNLPDWEPHVVASSYSPTPRLKPTPDGFTAGTCLTGRIPNSTVPVPAIGVTRVACSSKKAHYKVIKTYLGTSDMRRCDAVSRTQYAFSETRTRNGVPVHQYVYCLIGLGKYAR
jgi:hypothetical protein